MIIINGYYRKNKNLKSLDTFFYLDLINHNVYFYVYAWLSMEMYKQFLFW